MKRIFTMVLDPFGIGVAEDVERFGGVGADILGHIVEVCAKGEADNGHKGPLNLPNLTRLGLVKAHEDSTGFVPVGADDDVEVIDAYAWVHEMPSGKDIPSGRWEIAGISALFEWGYSSGHESSFPQELLDKLIERANLPDYLGNYHSSDTVILDQPGEEHMKTGRPIFYTFADSMFQIAYHEETPSLDKLYELCEIAREELTNSGYNIGRVIARSLIDDKAGNFQCIDNRHNPAVKPPVPTMLQRLVDEKHGQVVSTGKIADIYTNCGITKKVEVTGPDALLDATIKEMKEASDNTIVFTNSVDFDSPQGHHCDVAGYVAGLELFDRCLPEPTSLLCDGGILIPTADHDYGPTWIGTDRTRKHIPALVYGSRAKPGSLGHCETFTDIGQTLVKYFGISDTEYGRTMF